MDIVIKIILGVSGVAINYIFFSSYFKPRYDNKLKILIIISSLALAGSIINSFFSNSFRNLIVTIITLYTVCFTMFYGRIIKKLLLGIIYLLFVLVLDLIISFLTAYFIDKSIIDIVDNPNIPILARIFYFFIEFIMIWNLKHNRIRNEISGEKNIYLKQIVIPLMSVISVFLVVSIQLTNGKINYEITTYIIVFLVIINIAQYHIYEKLELLYQNNYDTMLITQELKSREEYYVKLEICQDEIRKIKHDLRNELLVLKGYLTLKQYDNVLEYIDMIIKDVVYNEELLFTQNIAVNILLSIKYNECMIKNINCDFEVKIPPKIRFDDKDITRLLGNALDNAIEACDKCDKRNRYIKLLLVFHNSSLILEIENSTDGKVRDLITKKANIKEHGLGIKSIRAILDKYNGDSEYKVNDYSVKLLLNLWEV